MIYPSVGQYTEAIKLAEQSPEDYFATKTTLRPVLGADGNPVMSSGNFAVVFKMQDQNDGKIYALNALPATKRAETKVTALSPTNCNMLSRSISLRFNILKKNYLLIPAPTTPSSPSF